MTYLVRSFFGIKEIDSYEEVLYLLRKCTAYWCASDTGIEEDYISLYNECLEEQDFGDIAQVFSVDCYFLVCDNRKVPCALYSSEKNIDFKMKRIF